jgi:hypothetical protein
VTVTENTTFADRTAILTVTAGNTSGQQASVRQKGEVQTVFGNGITAAENFGGGSGTQDDPYLIADARHLKKLVDDKNNNYSGIRFKLTTDMEVTADEWIPIGNSYAFQGVFDGDGHTISGTLKSPNHAIFGFFGYLHKASVFNLNIAAAAENEYASAENHSYTGVLVGQISDSDIHDCNISGSATGGNAGSYVCSTGGLAGRIEGNSMIRDCKLSGTVKGRHATRDEVINGNRQIGSSYTGGVAGKAQGNDENPVTISNCTVSGPITGGDATGESETGGIAGSAYRIEIIKCTIANLVSGGTGFYGCSTGGVAGGIGGNSTVRNCDLSGTVKGGRATLDEVIDGNRRVSSSRTGGVAGQAQGSDENSVKFLNCMISSSITGGEAPGDSETGGIAGHTSHIEIANCTVSASGNVTGGKGSGEYTGGITGLLREKGIISGCTNHAPVAGKNNNNSSTGGIVGQNWGKIHTSLNTGNVTASSGLIGGLVGYSPPSWVDPPAYVYSCCTNTGRVNGQPASSSNQIGNSEATVTPCPDGHAKR